MKLTTCAMLALAASFASHAATITAGNNPQPNENNILLNTGQTGTTVQGTLNQFPGLLVNFTSNQSLTEPSNGQARIEASNGSALTTLTVSLANNVTFGDLIFNPAIIGNLGNGGNGTVTALTTAGSFQQNFNFGNGNNFITVLAGANEGINSVTVSVPGGFASFQQPRISGPFTSSTTPVPEPSAYALCATGLAALLLRGLRQRRRQSI